MSDLKPCPFCGGEAIVSHVEAHSHTPALKMLIPDIDDAEDTYWPECAGCGAQRPGRNTREDAIASWNTRSDHAPLGLASRPTDAQLASACMSYRHDFGLLDATAKKNMMWQAHEWLRAWKKEFEAAEPAPRSAAMTKPAPAPRSSLPSGESDPAVTLDQAGAGTTSPEPDAVGEIGEIWQELLDKDDRTSPAEYPEMVLISFDELAQIVEDQHMRAAALLARHDRGSEAQ